MAASVAREVQGIVLALTSVNGGTFYPIGEVLSVTPPTRAMGTIDVTNHATTDYFREFLPGMIDPGTVTFTANYVSSSSWASDLVTSVMADRAKINWKLELSTGEAATSSQNVWYGNGYITNYQLITANDQAVTYSLSLKVTAKPTDSADTT
jgi:predicted secreted protein